MQYLPKTDWILTKEKGEYYVVDPQHSYIKLKVTDKRGPKAFKSISKKSAKQIKVGDKFNDWTVTQLRKQTEDQEGYCKLVNQEDFRVIHLYQDYGGYWYSNSFKGARIKAEKSLNKSIDHAINASKKYRVK